METRGYNLYYFNAGMTLGSKKWLNENCWVMQRPLQYIGWFSTEEESSPYVKGPMATENTSGYILTKVESDPFLDGWVRTEMKRSRETGTINLAIIGD